MLKNSINSVTNLVNSVIEPVKSKVEEYGDKVKTMYNIDSDESEKREYNPFTDKDGNVFNKYIDYQKLIDKPTTNDKVKEFITKATGIEPSLINNGSYEDSKNDFSGGFTNFTVDSPDGVFKNNELLGIIKRVSGETGVPANVLLAVAQQETGGKWYDSVTDGTGHSYGYMMLYDNGVIADLKAKGKSQLAEKAKTDPYTNVLVGAQYLKQNYDTYGNWEQATAKYNGAGPAAQKYGSTVWSRANSTVYKNAANSLMSSSNTVRTSSGIANAAQNYVGTPYVWGGSSTKDGGLDCSGFVYNALKDAGYNVPRTTAQGYRDYGTKVSPSSLKPGDLIFYGKNNNASHIGIYLGNGKVIHSSGGSSNTAANPGKGVTVSNINYRSDFIEARRC